MSDEKIITQLASELARTINETLGESGKIRKILKEIERHGYHIEMILSAAIGSSRDKLSPYLIKKILSDGHLKSLKIDEDIRFEFTEEDINFLKSLKIQITEETSR